MLDEPEIHGSFSFCSIIRKAFLLSLVLSYILFPALVLCGEADAPNFKRVSCEYELKDSLSCFVCFLLGLVFVDANLREGDLFIHSADYFN